jgi:hypothetical protein
VTPVILAVDPGGRWSGLCVRRGLEVLAHAVITRDGDEDGPGGIGVGPVYVGQVVARYAELVAEFHPTVLGVEGLRRPSPHVRRQDGNSLINMTGTLGAAAVYGGIVQAYPTALIVPPGKNGSMPLGAYPAELVGPRERTGNWRMKVGEGILRHARSAYDVAGSASILARLRASKPA